MGIIYKNGIPYGNQPSVDATLTHQGEPADAKATGDAVSELRNTLNQKADVIYDTASGDIASFPDGADGLPVKDLTVAIELVQSGTGDPSPTNVRPISGWTGANVANISDGEKQPYFAGLLNGTYGFVDLGTQEWSKNSDWGGYPMYAITAPPISPLPKGAQWSDSHSAAIIAGYENMTRNELYAAGNVKAFNITDVGYLQLRDSTVYADVAAVKAAMSGVYLIYELATPTTPTITQAQYNTLLQSFNLGGWLVPISWQSSAGTVYGGTLDVTTGVLTVTMGYVDLGTLNWNYGGVAFISAVLAQAGPSGEIGSVNPVICDRYKPKSVRGYSDGYANGECGLSLDGNQLIVKDTAYSSASDFKTAMSGVQFVYELAQPQTYQLDPVTVQTLLGQNNIWADCGPVSVDYPCDTKLYIQKINTPTDDDMIADAQIASGKYFIVNNNLYLSTTTILAGDPIKPGTNCTLTNLAAALNALNS